MLAARNLQAVAIARFLPAGIFPTLGSHAVRYDPRVGFVDDY
ncbi:hypothetical protein [Hydrocarboniphaga sp.]